MKKETKLSHLNSDGILMTSSIVSRRPLTLLAELASREVTGTIGLSGMRNFDGLQVHGMK